MPNWVKTQICFRSEDKENLINFINSITTETTNDTKTKKCFDFNKIIPEPQTPQECPEKFIIHNEIEARSRCLVYDEKDPKRWFDWYNWHNAFWGTKWNAYYTTIHDIVYTDGKNRYEITVDFETAWSFPVPIFEKLIGMCLQKNISFITKYSEEQLSQYGGKIIITPERKEMIDFEPYSDEMEEVALELWGYSWKDYEESDEDEKEVN